VSGPLESAPMREARISLSAIEGNVAALRETVSGTASMVIVKANGYGHGALPSARAALAGGAQWLGVADLTEARELRAAGITAPVLAWLHGPGADFEMAEAADIDLGISYREQLDAAAAASGTAVVHLKVDTGLGRNGAAPDDWNEFFAAAARYERAGRIRVRGIFSHLAAAGAAADDAQLAEFDRALATAEAAGVTPELRHIAATGAALARPDARYDLVRFGISAYGIGPSDEAYPSPALVPAMELSGQVVSVKRVRAGTGVSYGHDYRTTGPTTLVLVPLGYADGIPRNAIDGPVLLGGTTYPVVGRVAMDQVVLDVGDATVRVGDRAIFFGDPATGAPSASDWARAASTIGYEIVTRIGNRVARRYPT